MYHPFSIHKGMGPGGVLWTTTFKTAENQSMLLGMQLVHNLIISLHGNKCQLVMEANIENYNPSS